MRILIDTHFLVWIVTDRDMLRAAEREVLEDAESEVVVSAISIWELRVKAAALARRTVPLPPPLGPAEAIAFADRYNIMVHRPYVADYTVPLDPPLVHRDPFDEMLLVHAQRLGARLLTRDRQLVGHPLALQL